MSRFLRSLILSAGLLCSFSQGRAQPEAPPLASFPPVPSADQLAWQESELGLYLRLGLATYAGTVSLATLGDLEAFYPAKLDARQWTKMAKAWGVKRLVLEAKSSDGFCLWPSKTTDFTVASTHWRNGRGDVIKEFTDACREAGLEAGLSLSVEDHHHAGNSKADYDAVYLAQLTEVLTSYGSLAEIRFDGAGGRGSGATPPLDRIPAPNRSDHNWEAFFARVRALQPHAIIVSNIGPDARWNGNNLGDAGVPQWSLFNPASLPGPELTDRTQFAALREGDPKGPLWCPAECFVPLRPSWERRRSEDSKIVSLDRLFDIYCKSVGRNSTLLLNISLDEQGLIPTSDDERLRGFRGAVAALFDHDLAALRPVKASHVRGDDPTFAAINVTDGKHETYWAPNDDQGSDSWLEIDLGASTVFNLVELREPIALGQRISTYRIEIPDGDRWKTLVRGETIGRRKIERFSNVTADRIRLVIEQTRACPAISEFALYLKE